MANKTFAYFNTSGIKYCFKFKELLRYFLMRNQFHFYCDLLPRYSNLKMVQFWQDFGHFWPKNGEVSKNLPTNHDIALLVQILTRGSFYLSPLLINLIYIKKFIKYRVSASTKTIISLCFPFALYNSLRKDLYVFCLFFSSRNFNIAVETNFKSWTGSSSVPGIFLHSEVPFAIYLESLGKKKN